MIFTQTQKSEILIVSDTNALSNIKVFIIMIFSSHRAFNFPFSYRRSLWEWLFTLASFYWARSRKVSKWSRNEYIDISEISAAGLYSFHTLFSLSRARFVVWASTELVSRGEKKSSAAVIFFHSFKLVSFSVFLLSSCRSNAFLDSRRSCKFLYIFFFTKKEEKTKSE